MKYYDALLDDAAREPIAESLAQIPTAELIPALNELFAEPARVQETLLLEMVRRCRDTQFGREHGFSEIKSIEDYRKRVPVQTYAGFKPYIDKIKEGAEDVLTEGRPDYMLLTSGTTGNFKYLPESHESFRCKQNQFRARFWRWQELGLCGRGTTGFMLSSNMPVP